jgi:plastocyanin
MMRRLLLLVLAVSTLAVAGSTAAATSTAVSITSTGFHPNNVTIAAGDGVTWTNNDTAKHQVVANDGSFSSPVLSAKQVYSHTFRAGGTFAYHDGLRPSLRGTVIVIPVRTVWITSAGFVPSTITIRTGQSVTWVNRTSANQQVTAADASFASPVLAAGAHFSHTFPTAGTFGYRDALQPTMTGSVVVLAPPRSEALTLTSNSSTVTYGGSLTLSGTVANGTAGEKVTVTAHPQDLKTTQSVQTTTTGPDGSFSLTVKPLIRTVYIAATAKATSDPLTINVRPFMRLAHFSRTRGIVRVAAAHSMLHRYVLLQVWHPRTHVWSSVRRVRLTAVSLLASPTVVTRAVFRLHLRHGLRIRTWMPFSQVQPGYISGASNAIRS